VSSRAGLRVLRLTFLPAWLTNFVAAYGLASSTAAYDGGLGVYVRAFTACKKHLHAESLTTQAHCKRFSAINLILLVLAANAAK